MKYVMKGALIGSMAVFLMACGGNEPKQPVVKVEPVPVEQTVQPADEHAQPTEQPVSEGAASGATSQE